MKLVKIIFILSFIFSNVYSQTSVPIQSIRLNDANGAPLSLNQVVTVSGIVTCSNQYGAAGPAAPY